MYANYPAVLVDHPTLCMDGFDPKGPRFTIDAEKLDCITHLIPLLYQPSSTRKSNSYTMKHHVEERLGSLVKGYVSNGELILAMLYLGYEMKPRDGLNAIFLAKPTFPSGSALLSEGTRQQLIDYILFEKARAKWAGERGER